MPKMKKYKNPKFKIKIVLRNRSKSTKRSKKFEKNFLIHKN